MSESLIVTVPLDGSYDLLATRFIGDTAPSLLIPRLAVLSRYNPMGLGQLFTRLGWIDLNPLHAAWGARGVVYGVGNPISEPVSADALKIQLSREVMRQDIYLIVGSTVVYVSKRLELGFAPTVNQLLSESWRNEHPEGLLSAFDLFDPISWPFPKAIQNYSKFSRELLASRDRPALPVTRNYIAG